MKKRILTVMMALFMFGSVSTMAGCNQTRPGSQYNPLDPQSIRVVVSDLGFGTDWLNAIATAFENTHPGTTVTVDKTVLSSSLISQLEAGNQIGDVCMFNDDVLWSKWRDGLLVQLDDVVQATPDGEDKTIYEKTNKTLIDSYQVSNGHWYSVPWINENVGLVYNATSLEILLDDDWELPKTTEELWELCDRITEAGGYGFVWNNAYLSTDIWQAQYNGLANDEKYRLGYYLDETDEQWKMSSVQVECVEQNTGYIRALEQMEKIVQRYSHQYANNMTYIYAQATWAGIPYAGDEKRCVFMPNGDWTYNETLDYIIETQSEIGFFRYPVISDIVERLDLYEDGSTPYSQLSDTKKEQYDNILRTVIDYIDAGEVGDCPVNISVDDLDRIREARQITGGKCQAQAFIPYNSTKIDTAKEFLIFMASEMAVDIFSQSTYGYSPYISDEKLATVDYGIRFFNEVKDVLEAAPLKQIVKYTDIRSAGYWYPVRIAYHSDVKNIGAARAYQNGLTLIRQLWTDILHNADREAGQFWVDGSLAN